VERDQVKQVAVSGSAEQMTIQLLVLCTLDYFLFSIHTPKESGGVFTRFLFYVSFKGNHYVLCPELIQREALCFQEGFKICVIFLFFPLSLANTIMVKGCPAYPILKVLGSGAFGQVYLSKPPTSEEVRD
jgi:hypothetical protein